jgi:hypothetical protein
MVKRALLAASVVLGLGACGPAGAARVKLWSSGPGALPPGTKVTATFDNEIHSRRNTAGETVTATVSDNVKDEKGRLVLPHGATLTFRIAAIHESEHKGDPGTLRLEVESVNADGKVYPVSATVTSLERQLIGRKTNVNDIAKVGAGTGAGAVVGGVVGGKKGAVIGGVLGGAVGTQRAIETKDRDVYVARGSRVVVTLEQKLVADR